MVRDKYKELHKKYRDFRGLPPIRNVGGLVNMHSSQSHKCFDRGHSAPCREYRGGGYRLGKREKDRRDRSSQGSRALAYVIHGFGRHCHRPCPRIKDNCLDIEGCGNNGSRRRIGSPTDVSGSQGNCGYRGNDSGYYLDVMR